MNPAHIATSAAWLVPGQAEQRFQKVKTQLESNGSDFTAVHFVVFAIVAVILGIVVWRVARVMAMRDGRSYFSSKRMFQELCRLHELDLPSRRLLQRLAKARQLEHPGRLFLEPSWFEGAEIPSPLRPYREQLAQIRDQLFHSADDVAVS